MKKLFLTNFLLVAIAYGSFAQVNYLEKGNQYLNEGNNVAAERTFRDAIKSDSTNNVYPCQLALALINQEKHTEAQKVIEKVLVKDSANVGALWYAGMNNFLDKNADLRKSVRYFEKAIPLLDKKQGQFYSAHWFIGRAYQILLSSDGLSYSEVTRMLECYSVYVQLQPGADDAGKISSFVQHIKEIRPGDNVKKWVNSSQ